MSKFDEPIGPIPPLSPLERRWFRTCLALVVVLLALALFTVVALAEVPTVRFRLLINEGDVLYPHETVARNPTVQRPRGCV